MSCNSLRAQRVPCALHHLPRPQQKELGYDGFTLDEREMAFKYWVAWIRTQSEDVSAKEHRMCPLLWCRDSFEDLASVLQHVSVCPEFSSGWYWCPHCCRPEQFMADSDFRSREGSRQNSPGRKKSKLRRAVKFFKALGHKKDSGGSSSLRISDPGEELFDGISPKEIDGSPRRLPELATGDSEAHASPSNNEGAGNDIYEIETQPRCTSRMDAGYNLCELDSGHISETMRSLTESGASKTSLECIGSQFSVGDSMLRESQEASIFVCPISEGHNIPNHNIDDRPSPRDSIASVYAAREPFDSRLSLREVHTVDVQDTFAETLAVPEKLSPAHEDHNSPLDCNIQATESQVDELRDLVHVLNIEWIRRLELTPNLEIDYSVYYVPSLFDTGVQTLQRCYKNTLPTTFKEVFALMHVACAIVYLLHGDDSSFDWDDFFQNMLQWRHAMLGSDAWLLVEFVNLLLFSEGSSGTPFVSNGGLFNSNGGPFATTVPGSHAGIRDSTTPDTPQNIEDQSWQHARQSALIRDLPKTSKVITECSHFFHAFERAEIVERTLFKPSHLEYSALQYAANIDELFHWIIDPLKRASDIDEFHGRIADTGLQLRNGLLRTAREVEVWLTSGVKCSSHSPEEYTRYVRLVADRCNDYMQEAGPHWREGFYATDLYKVLAISREIDNRHKRLVTRETRQRPASAPFAPSKAQYALPTSRNTTSIMTPTTSSTSTFTSETPMSFSQFHASDKFSMSPNSSFSLSSPTSSTSTIASQTLVCHPCLATFTGEYQKSNYERHIRTTKRHGDSNGLMCQVTGCGSILSRSDNMSKHMRTVHQIVVPSRHQGGKRRRRSSDAGD